MRQRLVHLGDTSVGFDFEAEIRELVTGTEEMRERHAACLAKLEALKQQRAGLSLALSHALEQSAQASTYPSCIHPLWFSWHAYIKLNPKLPAMRCCLVPRLFLAHDVDIGSNAHSLSSHRHSSLLTVNQ